MHYEILTLFPDMLDNYFNTSIIGRARAKGLFTLNTNDIRSYTKDKHRRVDDSPYGGGFGLVMACQPIVDCIRDVKKRLNGSVRTIYFSPQGSLFNQQKAKELLQYDNLILLCGHYEGIDERVIELEIDEEISIGDYVLTGGEIAAEIVVDATARLLEGVLKDPECYEKESLSDGLLEYPQYTRPRVFEGLEVPEVLVNGNHAEIKKWQAEQSLLRTLKKRPDLIKTDTEEKKKC
ncbi:MAG: tRNA (guanosine(37)-N1)-methyltransferase TrmD [Clostridia bacterium]|nr:tRNA (guanosine(37)-N1)-methyltransferase TrmD [Clostridia bacterium]